MDDDKNDYDRIAERLSEITSIVWTSQKALEKKEYWGKALVPFALTTAVAEMNQLAQWVHGLAETHHNMKDVDTVAGEGV